MHLYNFIYYKSLFDFNNYEYLVRYNNYYISGLNSSTCQNPEITTISRDPIKYQPIKYNKILIPEFKYPILEDEKYNYANKDLNDIKDDIKNNINDDINDLKDEYKQPNLFDRIFNFF